MAETYTLEAEPRTIIGKQVKQLRRADLVPAVIYGLGEAIHITCKRRALEIVLQKASGTHLVNITVDGNTHDTLVRAVQRDVIRRDILHVDFLKVDLSKKLRAEVSILLVNVPKLGADLMLAHPIVSVEVECLPTNIPDHIEVDASRLKALGAKLTVADLPAISGVVYLSDAHDVIARVESLTGASAEETTEDSTIMPEPEVIERGKKQEEDF
ncbi:MAG: 50S ribosomal protein L25 [Chloroflexi bacterium CFX4]|nr:50S ribosomal protein L25 [Chloroflexi bacterium CFX4]MDL1923269.1 50S ribosomal protein L25 [Chloroflexi bacterium CFX3]